MIGQLTRDYFNARKSKLFPRLLSYFFYEGRPATTKGRWFNPITFLAIKKASNYKINENSESPVFIVGTGRSGSTILGMILSLHPDIGFLNEPKALWFLANSKDDLIGSYSKGDALYFMNATHATPKIAGFVKGVYSSFLNRTGSKKILDKFPEMIFRIEYLNQIFSHPKYLFLFRNPWETIASTALWSEEHRTENSQEDWWGVKDRKWNFLVQQVVPNDIMLAPFISEIVMLQSQTDKAAVEWIVTMNHGLKMMKQFPEAILPVKYEELAAQPDAILKKIILFCNMADDTLFISYGKKVLRQSNTVRKVTLHPILISPINILSEKLGYGIYSPSMSVTE